MSNQVYVNGVFSGGFTNTAKFSLYISPYLVANQGGRYTKHIYAGSQRIVSKVGDLASYGSDPHRIEYAGAKTGGLSVNYKAKYAAQQQVIKETTRPLMYLITEPTTTTMPTAKDSVATTDPWRRQWHKLRRPRHAQLPSRSKTLITTRTCSSSTIPTTLETPAISPILTARYRSTSSMCRSAKYSSKSATIRGTPLISSMPKSLTRRQVCTTMVQGIMSQGLVCG